MSNIRLPPERAGEARRSVALYFYSADRPEEELADTHSTVYVDRPLPARFQAGHTLDADDALELQSCIGARDQHIQRLYREQQALQAQLDQALKGMGLVRGTLPFRMVAATRRALRRVIGGRGS